MARLISHRKVGGVPRSWAAGSSRRDGLMESRKRDIGSNPIHDSSSEGLHSIEEKKEALRTDSQSRQGDKM